MTFLPIVGRELRVASRRRLTYWGRFSAAAFALLIFGGFQTIYLVGRGGFNPGRYQFEFMKWLCFVIACSAGIFLTADTLSEEKREGTLGLLFLTDLRGYDVVFGKLFARSTQAFYGLLAAFPIMGLSLLTGGVSGAEFGRTALVICNTLFLSLSLGLFVSSVSRDAMKALNGTLLLLLLLVGLTFIGDLALAHWNASLFKPRLCLASPAYLLSMTSAYLTKDWWSYLGLQHFLAWLPLIVSSLCVPRAWQDKAIKTNASGSTFGHRWRFGGQRTRIRRRRAWLNINPLLWLAARDQWLRRFAWTTALLSLGIFLWRALYFASNNTAYWLVSLEGLGQMLIRWVFFLWVASQASRFFVDAIRNGAMELILVTPVTPAQILKGQWRALRRTFLMPVLLLLLVQIADQMIRLWEMYPQFRKTAAVGGKAIVRVGFNQYNPLVYEIIGTTTGVISLMAGLLAVAWFGMWMGMTSRKTSMAVLKTMAFVIVVPWLVIMFSQGMTMAILMMPYWRGFLPFWTATIVAFTLNIAKDLFFILWSRKRLATRFTQQAARDEQIPHPWPTPPPVSAALPPVRTAIAIPPMQPPAPPSVSGVIK